MTKKPETLESILGLEEEVEEELSLLKEIKRYFPSLKTNKELRNDKDIKLDWLVDGLLLQGGSSLLVAEPKVGKSFFARQLAVAVAKGTKVLNRNTKQGFVFYISVEDHPAWIKKHMQAMNAENVDNITWSLGRIKELTFPQGIDFICKKLKPSLIVIDTMFKVFRTNDINDYNAMIDALQEVTELARKHNTHILYIHHVNKGNRAASGSMDALMGNKKNTSLSRIMGSMGIAGEVDNILFLSRQGDTRFITTIPRVGDSIDDVLYWDEKRQIYLINEDV